MPAAPKDDPVPSFRSLHGSGGGASSLILTAVCPFVAYVFLTNRGVSEVPALAVAAIFPALATLLGWIRTRRPDVLGIGSLLWIAVTITISLATANPYFILLRGSAIGGVWAAICLGSLLFPKPVMFYVARHVAGLADQGFAARFDELWRDSPEFRRAIRRVTLVWGIVQACESVARVALVFTIPTAAFLVASRLMGFTVTLALLAWATTYIRRVARIDKLAIAEASARQ
jgi:hypothetical protein